ncbi:MAG: hypothetical protein PHW72_01995 [Candidatus Pacebacteria bacterium]|nr:hypothetical protein [Candidatus Paceibacterota bacterium]
MKKNLTPTDKFTLATLAMLAIIASLAIFWGVGMWAKFFASQDESWRTACDWIYIFLVALAISVYFSTVMNKGRKLNRINIIPLLLWSSVGLFPIIDLIF